MRIIAGKHRGRRLSGPRGHDLRPTADRLRETLFDILGSSVIEARFLDVFAGTGAVGLEALSRGAHHVVFIENDPRAERLIRQNLSRCRIEQGWSLLRMDVFRAIRCLGREGRAFDILYLDPPYRWQGYEELLDATCDAGLVAAGSRVIVEHHRRASIPESTAGLELIRTVRQGDRMLSLFSARPDPAPREDAFPSPG